MGKQIILYEYTHWHIKANYKKGINLELIMALTVDSLRKHAYTYLALMLNIIIVMVNCKIVR